MALSTNGTVLTRLAGALYNTQMSNATYKEVASLDPSALADVLYARDFSAVTDATVAATLVANLGLTAVEGLTNWVAAQLTAAGSHKGAKVVELLNGFAQMSADATYGAAATAFNTKVDAALALSQTTDNAGGTFAAAGTVTVSDATFALTTGVNVKTLGSGNDTFDATVAASLDDGDDLNGGAGVDRVNARYTADGNHAPDMTSVEQLYVRFDASSTADVTFDLDNSEGVTIAVADRINAGATGTLTFDNMDLSTAAGVYKGNGSGDVTFTFASTTGTADAASLSLMDADVGTVTISNVETLTINGTIGSSVVDSLAASSVDALNINATESVTITASDLYEDAVVTITGAGNVTLGLDDAKTVVASSATGNIKVTGVDETEVYSIVTGSGNDTFESFVALAATDIITAGAGTDRLRVNYNITDGILDGVTGVEEIEYQKQAAQSTTADLSIDMDAFNGNAVSLIFTQVSSTAAFDDITVTNFVTGTTVTVNAANVQATAVFVLTADTDADATATVVLKSTDADGVDIASTSNDFNEIATLNVQSVLDTGVTQSTTAESSLYVGSGSDDLDTINISGAANLQLTAAETEVDLIDGSTATGRLTIGVAGSAANVTVNGGSNADTITLTASTDVVVNGGGGNDTIAFGATLTDNDVIDGGSGTNTLTFTVNGFNDDIRISNVATVTITDATAATAASTIDFNNVSGVSTINVVAQVGTAATSNVITLDDVGASITTLILDAASATADDDVVLDLYADTTADSLSVRVDMDGTEFDGDVTADDPETVNLTFAYTTGGTAVAALATATFADATSIVIANTDNDGTATTYLAGNYLSIAKLDVKTGATIDLTGWNFDVGVANLYTSALSTTVADSATATAVTAADFGTVGLTLVGADAVTIKLEDGEIEATSAFYISLGASNAGIDTIEFVNNESDDTDDIGAVILAGFLAAGANSVSNRTKIDLTAFGVGSLSDLNILDGAQAANSSNGTGDVTFIFAADGQFLGNIQLVGIDAALVTADNFIFS
jgi:hypothetical protein